MCRTPALLVPLALAAAPLAAQSPPQWPVDARPITTAGGADAPEAAELLNVRSAAQLGNGMVVVANGKPVTLKVFDARGRHVRNIGRTGGGPGEFTHAVDVLAWGGDTLLALSGSGLRHALYRPDGTLVREWTAASAERRLPARLMDGAVVRTLDGRVNRCTANVVAALPDDQMHEVIPTTGGRAWVRAFGASRWTIRGPDGATMATVVLPDRFDPYTFTDSTVLGRRFDADDIERVELLRVRGTPVRGRPACAAAEATFAPGPPETLARLRSDLRNLMTAGEMHYARTKRYPRQVADLAGIYEASEGTRVHLLEGTSRGWAVAVRDGASGAACLMAIGPTILAAWPDGVLVCGG